MIKLVKLLCLAIFLYSSFFVKNLAYGDLASCSKLLESPLRNLRRTEIYLTLIRHLVKEKNVFTVPALQELAGQTLAPNPLIFISASLSSEDTHAFNKAFQSLKDVDWDLARKEIEKLINEQKVEERDRKQAKQKTKSIYLPVLLKESIEPVSREKAGAFIVRKNGEVVVGTEPARLTNLTTGESIEVAPHRLGRRQDFYEDKAGELYFAYSDHIGGAVTDVNGHQLLRIDNNDLPDIALIQKSQSHLITRTPFMSDDGQGHLSLILAPHENKSGHLGAPGVDIPATIIPFGGGAAISYQLRNGEYWYQRLSNGHVYGAGLEYPVDRFPRQIVAFDLTLQKELFRRPAKREEVDMLTKAEFKFVEEGPHLKLYGLNSGKPSKKYMKIDLNTETFSMIPWGVFRKTYVTKALYTNRAFLAFLYERDEEFFVGIKDLSGQKTIEVPIPFALGDPSKSSIDFIEGPNGDPIVLVWEREKYDSVSRIHIIDGNTENRISYTLDPNDLVFTQRIWKTPEGYIYAQFESAGMHHRLLQVYGPIPEGGR